MKLLLHHVPHVMGIYKGTLPERMKWLLPAAAESFREHLADWVTVSDMFRSPESSLLAVRSKRGAKAPGFSAHNFGLAIDIDVKESMHACEARTKVQLDDVLRGYGWYCHRVDGEIEHESWHYNFLDVGAVVPKGAHSTASLIESKIVDIYGPSFVLTTSQVQQRLLDLKMYRGKCDGVAGPLTKEAIRVFQRAWVIRETGIADTKTQRTLAYVAD